MGYQQQATKYNMYIMCFHESLHVIGMHMAELRLSGRATKEPCSDQLRH